MDLELVNIHADKQWILIEPVYVINKFCRMKASDMI